MSVTVILNGREATLDCEPTDMLLEVLRDSQGLRSVRETCRIGVCGACTILLDGEPVTGCLTMAAQVNSHDLRDAIEATLACKPVAKTTASAFGCTIKRD